MKRLTLLAFAFMVIMPYMYGENGSSKGIQLTSSERSMVAKNNQFALNLFDKLRGGNDMVLSPLSVTYALGMTNNGAAGQTQQEINQVLGFGEGDADAINAFCRKMLTEGAALDSLTDMQIANTLFVNGGLGYQLMPAFEQVANEYYDAEPQNRDFADGQTLDAINQWSSDHTRGMIPVILRDSEFDPNAVSYLLNAIYFKGIWTLKFPKDSTCNEKFNGSDEVPMMHLAARLDYHEDANYQAVSLPYGNESFRMVVLLPQEGKTIGDVLGGLDADAWGRLVSVLGGDSVDVKLPRIETETEVSLKDALSALGMPSAFSPEAGFPDICVNTPVYISGMKQAAKLKLDEEGTEAAAVTVEVLSSAPDPESGHAEKPVVRLFHATRPFMYAIIEQSTGSICFIGQYLGVDPDKTPVTNAIGSYHQDCKATDVYTLDGRRVTAPLQPGIYIRDGKKIVVK